MSAPSWLKRCEGKRSAAAAVATTAAGPSRSSSSGSTSSCSSGHAATATTAGVIPFFFSSAASPNQQQQQQQHIMARSHFTTLARIWAMWRAISWLNSHKQFMSLGVVLAEYATKSALSYLPPDQQSRCEHLLSLVGMNVENVGLATIGQSALSVAMTGGRFDAAPNTTPTSQHHFDVWRLMDEVVRIAALPPALDPRLHKRFADALNQGAAMNMTVQQASVHVYGMPCALWTKGGLHELRRSGGSGKVTWQQLERAYAESHLAACEGAAWVRALGPSALQALSQKAI